jgi:hypothetical protein
MRRYSEVMQETPLDTPKRPFMLVTRMTCSSTRARPLHASQSGHILRPVRKEGLALTDQARATQNRWQHIAPSISHPCSKCASFETSLSISPSGLTNSHTSVAIGLPQNYADSPLDTVNGYDVSVGLGLAYLPCDNNAYKGKPLQLHWASSQSFSSNGSTDDIQHQIL